MAHSDADSPRRITPLRPLSSRPPAVDEPPSWAQVEHHGRVRRRIISIGILAALLVAALGALVWNAESRYRAGKLALDEGRYGAAIANFTAARVLFVSYRDADVLRQEAQDELQATADAATRVTHQQEKVAILLAAADRLLSEGAFAAALEKLEAAAAVVPDGPLPLSAEGETLRTGVSQRLRDGAQKALAEARWLAADLQAAALLVLIPGDPQANRLAARAEQGAALQSKVAAARAAGRRGAWREALRLANLVLAVRRDFPGAAEVAADARAALAPKPKPKPTPSATPAPVPTTAPPPPPPPAPQPTQPPPP